MLRKSLSILSALLLFCSVAFAQNGNRPDRSGRSNAVNVIVKIQDAATSSPVQYVTVYLVPEQDTVVTTYAITDEGGGVTLRRVRPGKYYVNAEFTGYKPFRQLYNLISPTEDLGTIKMEEDIEMLEAATVVQAGNPVEIKGDTIVFNASAFHTSENSMLSDLLKKMPGVEVEEGGGVTVNGERVDRILVDGKTFFANDNSMALDNLPAKIIEKVNVIDRERKDAQFTGISNGNNREKVLDLSFKEDYSTGWFGNANISAGYNLTPKNTDAAGEAALADSRGFLWNGRGMVTRYNDHGQSMGILRGENVGGQSGGNGVHTSANAGLNINTDRLKGFETNVSANYRYNQNDRRSVSNRTSFQADGTDLLTGSSNTNISDRNTFTVSFDIEKKDRNKFLFEFEPSFSYQDSRSSSSQNSSTSKGGSVLNRSGSSTSSTSRQFGASGDLQMGIRNLGNPRRSLTFSGDYELSHSTGGSLEQSLTSYSDSASRRNLRYDNGSNNISLSGTINYVEPFGEHWAFQSRLSTSYSNESSVRDAFDADDGSAYEYYSSWNKTNYLDFRGRFLMQYNKDRGRVQFGVQLDERKNVNSIKSRGEETTTGDGLWLFNWSPYVNYRNEWGSNTLTANYNGNASTPGGSSISSALNISDPVRISTGNIYLRPSYSHTANVNWRFNNKKTFAYLNVSLRGTLNLNNTVTASWYDAGGIRYSVPVNTRTPGTNANLSITYNRPLDKDRRLTFSISGSGQYSGSTSYQARGKLAGIDSGDFDYKTFMADFWGNEDGDRFYSGQSGFDASRTQTVDLSGRTSLRYRLDRFSASAGFSTTHRNSTYSMQPSANLSTWNHRANAEFLYETPHQFEIQSNISYNFYQGYSDGFNTPHCIWNAELSKSFGSVTLTISMQDILNQTRNLSRNMTAEYVEDSYTNSMGRYFLAGISFNFGKMNNRRGRGGQGGGGNWQGGQGGGGNWQRGQAGGGQGGGNRAR